MVRAVNNLCLGYAEGNLRLTNGSLPYRRSHHRHVQ